MITQFLEANHHLARGLKLLMEMAVRGSSLANQTMIQVC